MNLSPQNLMREIEWDDFGKGGNHTDFIYEDFIAPEICDELLQYYNDCTYLKKKPGFIGYSDPTGIPQSSERKVSTDMCCHAMLADTEPSLQHYLTELDRVMKNYFTKYEFALIDCAIFPMFNIQTYPARGGYKVWHFERTNNKLAAGRQLVWMTYLTDNPDGGTEFYYQSKYYPAKKGSTLIWPADWTHTHRGRVVNEEKAIITGWIEFS